MFVLENYFCVFCCTMWYLACLKSFRQHKLSSFSDDRRRRRYTDHHATRTFPVRSGVPLSVDRYDFRNLCDYQNYSHVWYDNMIKKIQKTLRLCRTQTFLNIYNKIFVNLFEISRIIFSCSAVDFSIFKLDTMIFISIKIRFFFYSHGVKFLIKNSFFSRILMTKSRVSHVNVGSRLCTT